jgi:membrane-associated phospholipid phosphatase
VRAWLIALTDFGDAAVLLPLAVAILVWLRLGASRLAWAWTITIVLSVALTAVLKIFFYACPPAADVHSPSGHTALSILVYGTLALTTAVQWGGWRRLLAIAIGSSVILMIAASRLLLHAHSVPEVGLGFVIGSAFLAFFARNLRRYSRAKPWPLLIAAGLLASIFHGEELHAEEFLHRITGYLPLHCS